MAGTKLTAKNKNKNEEETKQKLKHTRDGSEINAWSKTSNDNRSSALGFRSIKIGS